MSAPFYKKKQFFPISFPHFAKFTDLTRGSAPEAPEAPTPSIRLMPVGANVASAPCTNATTWTQCLVRLLPRKLATCSHCPISRLQLSTKWKLQIVHWTVRWEWMRFERFLNQFRQCSHPALFPLHSPTLMGVSYRRGWVLLTSSFQ